MQINHREPIEPVSDRAKLIMSILCNTDRNITLVEGAKVGEIGFSALGEGIERRGYLCRSELGNIAQCASQLAQKVQSFSAAGNLTGHSGHCPTESFSVWPAPLKDRLRSTDVATDRCQRLAQFVCDCRQHVGKCLMSSHTCMHDIRMRLGNRISLTSNIQINAPVIQAYDCPTIRVMMNQPTTPNFASREHGSDFVRHM
jgi:hypothetical protein